MAWTDLERRRDGIIGASSTATGSFDPNAIPYQYAGTYGSETKVEFPFESQWIQITALTSDNVYYSFTKNATGTALSSDAANYGAVAGNSTSGMLPIKASEIFIKNDAAITIGLSLIASGTNTYDMDSRY